MFGNRTLVLGLALALAPFNQPAAVEVTPWGARFECAPWHYSPRRGKGERKRERGSRWGVTQRNKRKDKNYGT